ncbi:hypothetical protein Gotur_016505 [Gossypium turneri]
MNVPFAWRSLWKARRLLGCLVAMVTMMVASLSGWKLIIFAHCVDTRCPL